MKLSVIGLVGLLFVLNSTVMASESCNCDPSDNDCITKCVTDTNDCITDCNGDVDCYENCINGWPGVSSTSGQSTSTSTITTVTTTATTTATTIATTVTTTATTMSTTDTTVTPSSATVVPSNASVPVSTATPVQSGMSASTVYFSSLYSSIVESSSSSALVTSVPVSALTSTAAQLQSTSNLQPSATSSGSVIYPALSLLLVSVFTFLYMF